MNYPFTIELYIVRHKDTGKEREFDTWREARSYSIERNSEYDDYAPWEIFGKLKPDLFR